MNNIIEFYFVNAVVPCSAAGREFQKRGPAAAAEKWVFSAQQAESRYVGLPQNSYCPRDWEPVTWRSTCAIPHLVDMAVCLVASARECEMSLNGFLPDRLQRSMQNSDRSNYMLECPTELIRLCESSFFYCSSAVSSSTRMIPKVANNYRVDQKEPVPYSCSCTTTVWRVKMMS